MSVSRRSALRAAAWTVPAVSIAAAAPAFATSTTPRKDPGINGWVQVSYGTSKGFDATFDSDPAGIDPATPDGAPFGLYLYDTQPGDLFSAASITLWFRAKVNSWTYGSRSPVPNGGGHGDGWNRWETGWFGVNTRVAPTYVGAETKPDGFKYHGYRFDYTGTFSNLGAADGLVWLQDFEATAKNVQHDDATFWVERRIAVNGQMFTFQRRNGERGPLGEGFPASRARMSASSAGSTSTSNAVFA